MRVNISIDSDSLKRIDEKIKYLNTLDERICAIRGFDFHRQNRSVLFTNAIEFHIEKKIAAYEEMIIVAQEIEIRKHEQAIDAIKNM